VFGLLVARAIGTKSFVVKLLFLLTIGISKIGGLLNSCNGLTTTALQFGIPILLLVYYAGDIGDNAFHMVGLVTEPVLQGLGIKHIVMRDPAKVKQDIAGAVTLANSSKRPVALLLTRAVL
jgi:sulfopyruvate decarboxylase TPP-binding subunit